MKRFLLALACAWLAVVGGVQDARAATPVQVATVLSGQQSAYPGATVALDFVGLKCAGQPRCFKAGGVTTTNFAALPGVTITRASGGYAEDQTGALTWFNSGQARITNKGLLVEEARTNIALQSQVVASWGNNANVTISPDVLAAPDGSLTADKVVENTAASVQHLAQFNFTTSATTTYAFAVYAHAGERTKVQFGINGGSTSLWAGGAIPNALFDLQSCATSSVASGATASCQSLANGWERLVIVATTSGSTGTAGLGAILSNGATTTYTGDGVSGAYAWQQDAQVGAFITSPIPTTSASATRAADDISLTMGSAVTFPAYVAAGFTKPTIDTVNTARVIALRNPGNTNRLLGAVPTSSTNARIANNATSGTTAAAFPVNVATQMAFGADASNLYIALGGGDVTTSAGTAAADLSVMDLGSQNGGTYLNGYLRSAVIYQRQPTTTLLQQASAADLSSLSLNFASGTYRAVVNGNVVQSTSLSNFATTAGYTLTTTRASSAYASDSAGNLISFGSNVPRITDLGLLVEEARTNLALQSQALDNAAWTKTRTSVTADVSTAPDGTSTADLLTATSTGSVFATQAVTVSSGTTYTVAAYVKKGVAGWAIVGAFGPSGQQAGTFVNLSTCALGSIIDVTWVTASRHAVSVAQGFCRVDATFTPNATTANLFIQLADADANFSAASGDTLLAWQADLQAGAFITSPIFTTSASATRPADVIALTGLPSAFPYSIGVSAMPIGLPASGNIDLLNSGPDANNLQGFYLPSNQVHGFVETATVTTANSGTTPIVSATVGTIFGAAVRFNTNDFNVAANGNLGTQDTSTAPVGMTALNITATGFGGTKFNGYIRQIPIYPYAANDNELQYRSAGNW